MPTPLYTLRLPKEAQDNINRLAKIYGAPNGRAFAREILETFTGGDVERLKEFNAQMIRGMGEQLTLELNASLDALKASEKPAKTGLITATHTKPAPKRRKA